MSGRLALIIGLALLAFSAWLVEPQNAASFKVSPNAWRQAAVIGFALFFFGGIATFKGK